DDELVAPSVRELGQGEVEAGPASRTRSHRGAEAGAAGPSALHRDEERAVPIRSVRRIRLRAAEKDPVLPGDRHELARADAEKRPRPRLPGLGLEGESLAFAPRGEQADRRRGG